MKNRYFIASLLLVMAFGVSSCEKSNVKRTYEEITLESPLKTKRPVTGDPHAFMKNWPQDDPHAGLSDMSKIKLPVDTASQSNWRWVVPKDWIELKGSGMRLATFRTKDNSNPIECSIVTLGGKAGGLKANVIRWMRQINLTAPSDQELDTFLAAQQKFRTTGDLQGTFVDLTSLDTTNKTGAPSMIASVIEAEDAVVFIKMTGSIKALRQNFKNFQRLSESLQQSK